MINRSGSAPHRTRLALVALALVTASLSLTACTGEATPEPDPSPTPSESDAVATPGLTDVQNDPGSGTDGAGGGFAGALADSDLTTCERTDAGWTLGGTLANPTDGIVDYRVYASLLADDGDTRALVQVNVDDVDPTASKEWTTDIAVDEDDLECYLRVERYSA